MAFFEDYGTNFKFFYGAPPFPGNMPAMHLHPHYEALLILDPVSSELFINQERYTPQAPFLAIVAPYNLHKSCFSRQPWLERFVFYFGNDMFEEFSGGFKHFFSDFHQQTATVIEFTPMLEEKIRKIMKPFDPKNMSLMEEKLVFLLVLNVLLENSELCKLTHFYKQTNYICGLVQYMCEHYDQPLTLDSLAEHFFISRSKLSMDFKKHTGTSPHRFLLDIRINRAQYYILRGTYDTVRDVAAAVGFENSLHFYSAFRKYVGTTPLQYAQIHNSNMKKI